MHLIKLLGKCDPTRVDRLKQVTVKEAITHLLKISIPHPNRNGQMYYPFAEHERLSFYANDRDRRHRMLKQASVFLKQHPDEAALPLQELKELISRGATSELIGKMNAYTANITGSDTYWNKCQKELNALFTQKHPGTLFWTLSFADNHTHELHRLLPGGIAGRNATSVNRNAHLVEWWFNEALESFHKHFFMKVLVSNFQFKVLGFEWSWYRIEFQGRDTVHSHGSGRMENDPGIIELTAVAYAGRLAEKRLNEIETSAQGTSLARLMQR
jgi:hypothetical protein